MPSEDQTTSIPNKRLTFKQSHYLRSKLDVHLGHFGLRGLVSDSSVLQTKQSTLVSCDWSRKAHRADLAKLNT